MRRAAARRVADALDAGPLRTDVGVLAYDARRTWSEDPAHLPPGADAVGDLAVWIVSVLESGTEARRLEHDYDEATDPTNEGRAAALLGLTAHAARRLFDPSPALYVVPASGAARVLRRLAQEEGCADWEPELRAPKRARGSGGATDDEPASQPARRWDGLDDPARPSMRRAPRGSLKTAVTTREESKP